jgi:hypothetical protein
MRKGEQTRQEIIRKAAPLFNQKGYEGTALSDLMQATGLYCQRGWPAPIGVDNPNFCFSLTGVPVSTVGPIRLAGEAHRSFRL